MRRTVDILLFVLGVILFILGGIGVITSEYTVRSIQLCWSPDCAREFIDALWRSVVQLLVGVINMLLGVAFILLAVSHKDDY